MFREYYDKCRRGVTEMNFKKQLKEARDLITKIYYCNSCNSELQDTVKERLSELNDIFIVQSSALSKIKEQQFFPALTYKFWFAFEMFLTLAQEACRRGQWEYLIHDSYIFIRAFDNALQGYFNSDRQFLEFPGHSVSLYDLPAKLGVAYARFIDMVIDSFQKNSNDNNDNQVAYLLCPEPFEEEGIHVRRLLSGFNSKELLIIEAPARLMFEPSLLLFALSHEIAHFVGREHRVFEYGNGNNRNKMLYQIHKIELPQICIDSFVVRLNHFAEVSSHSNESDYSEICEALINRFEGEINEAFEKYDPLQKQICSDLTYSEVKTLLKETFASPLMRNIDEIIIRRFDADYLDLNDAEKYFIQHTLLPEAIEYVISLSIEMHEYLFYIVKECVADILAINLLGMDEQDYINKITVEANKILDNDNLRQAISYRKSIVCKVAFNSNCEVEQILCEKSFDLLYQYLNEVSSRFTISDDNAIRSLFKRAKNSKDIPSMLSEYML